MMMDIKQAVAEKLLSHRRRILTDYDTQRTLTCYVPPNGQSVIGNGEPVPLQPWIEKDFLESDAQVLLLRGPGGSGKSTFNQNLLSALWQEKIWDEFKPGTPAPKAWVPLLIPLGSSSVNPKRLFSYLMQLPEAFTEEEINVIKSDYQLLLIADGYDEMPGLKHINLYDENQLSHDTSPIKLLISSRPETCAGEEGTYFVPHCAEGRLHWPLYKERRISPFNASQRSDYIQQYLEKNKSRTDYALWRDVATYERHFAAITGIESLLATPLVLMMAVEVLPSIIQDIEVGLEAEGSGQEAKNNGAASLQLTRAKLYDHFMARWFERQAVKAVAAGEALQNPETAVGHAAVVEIKAQKNRLPVAVRLLQRGYQDFCQNLAQHLQAQASTTICDSGKKGRLDRLKQKSHTLPLQESQLSDQTPLSLLFNKTPDRVLIRKGCPLRQESRNEYGFLHQSFIDYFVTVVIWQQNNQAELVQERLPADAKAASVLVAGFSQAGSTANVLESVSIRTELPLAARMTSQPPLSTSPQEKVVTLESFAPAQSALPTRKAGRLSKVKQSAQSNNPMTRRLLARESIQFLADRVEQDAEFTDNLWAWIGSSRKNEAVPAITASANAITVLNAANKSFSAMDLNGIRIPGADLTGGVFYRTQLRDANLENVIFTEAHLEEADVSGSLMKGVVLSEKPLLKDHSLPIHCLAYDPEHDLAATGSGKQSKDCSIRIWDMKQGQLIDIFAGHTDEVVQVLFKPAQKEPRLISVSRDNTVREWDVWKAKELHRFISPTPLKGLTNIATVSSDGQFLVVACKEDNAPDQKDEAGEAQGLLMAKLLLGGTVTDPNMLRVMASRLAGKGNIVTTVHAWDRVKGVLVHSFVPHQQEVTALRWGPITQPRLLATSGMDNQLKLWDLSSIKKPQLCWQQSAPPASCISFLPDGSGILVYEPGGVVLRESKAGKRCQLYRSASLTDTVYSIASDESGQYIAAGDKENIEVWEAQTGTPITTLFGHSSRVQALAFSSRATGLLVSASHDRTVRLWQTERFLRSSLNNQFHHSREITSLLLTPDENTLISGSLDGSVRFWQPQTGQLLKAIQVSCRGVTALTLTPQGNELLAGDDLGNVHRLSLETFKEVATLQTEGTYAITSLSVNQHRRRKAELVTGNINGDICLWNWQRNKLVGRFTRPQGFSPLGPIVTLRFSKDGVRFYSSDLGRGVLEWSIPMQKLIAPIADDTPYLALMPNEESIVCAHATKQVLQVWNLNPKQLHYTMKGHEAPITSLAANSFGRLASGDAQGNVLLWNQDHALQARLKLPSKSEQLVVTSKQWIYASGAKTPGLLAYEIPPLDPTNIRLAWRQGAYFHARGLKCKKVQGLSLFNRQRLLLAGAKELDNDPSSEARHHKDYALDASGRTPLIRAVEEHDDKAVTRLLEAGVEVNHMGFNGWTPLQAAANAGYALIIKVLLQYRAEINQATVGGNSPLFIASRLGHENAVQILLEHRAGVEQGNEYDCTPLHAASAKGHLAVVQLLLAHKAEVNRADSQGQSALHFASVQGEVAVIKALVEHKAKVDQVTISDHRTPLHMACSKDHLLAIKTLLNARANVNQSGKEGISPLQIAANRGKLETVQVLLEERAAVNQADNQGRSALWVAALRGHNTIIAALLGNKAAVNQASQHGSSPLYVASEYGHDSAVEILTAHKADVNQLDTASFSPLYIASKRGRLPAVKVLLAHKAHVNGATIDGLSPLHIASMGGHDVIVQTLLEHKAKVNQPQKQGASPLFMTAAKGNDLTVRLLLEHKADVQKPLVRAVAAAQDEAVKALLESNALVNRANREGDLPLHTAAAGGYISVLKVLLDHKADVNLMDAKGDIPLQMALHSGQEKIVQLLLESKAMVNQENGEGLLTLAFAAARGSVSLVQTLLEHKAEVNQRGSGWSALHYAVLTNQMVVIKLLLDSNADIHLPTTRFRAGFMAGITALGTAGLTGNGEAVTVLEQHPSRQRQELVSPPYGADRLMQSEEMVGNPPVVSEGPGFASVETEGIALQPESRHQHSSRFFSPPPAPSRAKEESNRCCRIL